MEKERSVAVEWGGNGPLLSFLSIRLCAAHFADRQACEVHQTDLPLCCYIDVIHT